MTAPAANAAPDWPRPYPNPPDLSAVPCWRCGAVGSLRLELRLTLVAKPLGTYSVAGVQMKASCIERPWPWMVCDACGADCRGKQ